jgi:hypothetical protein
MLEEAWTSTMDGITYLLPKLVMAVLILVVGVLVGRLLRALTLRFFIALRLDRVSDRLWISALLERGDARHTVAEVVATVVYWLVLILALQMLGGVLGLQTMAHFFGQVLGYLPRVFVAVVVALVGAAIGSFFGGAVQVAAANAGLQVARPLGRLVKYAVVFFALTLAFEQLQIASRLLTTTFLVVVGAFSLGVALAFGIGCKDLARDLVVGWIARREAPPPSRAGRNDVAPPGGR